MAAANRQQPLVESPHLTDPGKQDRVNQGVPVVPAFDAYRGVAVLGIMVFHILGASGILIKAGDSPPAQLVWGTLPYTVFAFFIISGFVMFLPMASRGEFGSVRTFAIRRAARLFPALWVVLAICLLLMAVLPHTYRSETTEAFPDFWEILLNFSGQVNWALLFDSGQRLGFGVDPPIWTLTVEIAFYFVLPFVAASYFKRPLVGLAVAAAIAIGWREAVNHVFELASLFGTDVDPGFAVGLQFADAQLPYWSFAFGAGMTSAWLLVRLQSYADRDRLERYALIAAGAAALGLAACAYSAGHYIVNHPPEAVIALAWDSNAIAIGYTACLAGLMIALTMIPARLQSPFAHPAVAFLAEISYGVYLIHVVLIWAATNAFNPVKDGSIEATLLWFAIVLPPSLCYGYLSARFVENPIRRWAHRFARKPEPEGGAGAKPAAATSSQGAAG